MGEREPIPCPVCGEEMKQTGRDLRCPACGYKSV